MKGGRRIGWAENWREKAIHTFLIFAFEEGIASLSSRWYASVSVSECNRRRMQIRKQMLFLSNTTIPTFLYSLGILSSLVHTPL